MQKLILNLLTFFLIAVLASACSKKTTANADQTVVNEQKRPQKGGDRQRGKRPEFSDLLSKLDADKDGKLSQTEVQGRMKDDFARIDSDADGFITEAEFKAAAPPKRQRRD